MASDPKQRQWVRRRLSTPPSSDRPAYIPGRMSEPPNWHGVIAAGQLLQIAKVGAGLGFDLVSDKTDGAVTHRHVDSATVTARPGIPAGVRPRPMTAVGDG